MNRERVGGSAEQPPGAGGEARLRADLHDAVSDIEPTPGLEAIRYRTKGSVMSQSRPWLYAAAASAVAVAATVVGIAVLGGDNEDGPVVAATSTPTPSAEPTPEATPDPEPSQEPEPSATAAPTSPTLLPVYYLGDTAFGVGLYREFHRVPSGEDDAAKVAAAVEELFAGSALDPDYRSPWPEATTLAGAPQVGADRVVIDLSLADGDLRVRPDAVPRQEARLGIDQLVSTVQGALQRRPPVKFLLNGEPTPTVLGVDTITPVKARSAMRTQAPVWIIDPQQGDTLDGTFEVSGRGAFFEANVRWQLLTGDGTVVTDGFTTATECCTLAPYSFEISGVEPGTYTLRVFDEDASGEGNAENQDTKTIIVE